MNRRRAAQSIIALLCAWIGRSSAQQKVPIIAIPLIFAGPNDGIMQTLRRGLRERGWIDGENIRIEHRWTQGKVERLSEIIGELVRLKPYIYVAGALPIALALKQVAGSTPIVLVGWDYDPVAAGFAESLARPGGNITGVYAQSLELSGKRLEILKDLLPKLRRVAVIYDEYGKYQLEHFKSGAQALGLRLQLVEMSAPYNYEEAFKLAGKGGAEAVAVALSPRFYVERKQVAQAALKYRMPAISDGVAWVVAGGLICYGADSESLFGRVPYFIDRILKGAKPSELPIEQPNIYRLAINLTTAKALGITVPESIMIRVDEVIK